MFRGHSVACRHSVCCIAHAHTRTGLHILLIVCWNGQVRGAQRVLLSGFEQQCSVDPFRQSSTIPAHQKVPNSPGDPRICSTCATVRGGIGWQAEKGPSCVFLINMCRGAAHIIPHPLQQLLRLWSCPGLKLWQPPTESSGCRSCFSSAGFFLSWNPSALNTHCNTHTHLQRVVLMRIPGHWHLDWK